MEKLVGFRVVNSLEEEKKKNEIKRLEEKLIELLKRKEYDIVEALNLQRKIHELEDRFD